MQGLANRLLSFDDKRYCELVEFGIPGYKGTYRPFTDEEATGIYLIGCCRETLITYLKHQKDNDYFAIVVCYNNIQPKVVQFKKFINYLESEIGFNNTVIAYSDTTCALVSDRKWFNPVLISLYSLLVRQFLSNSFRFYRRHPKRSFERILEKIQPLFDDGSETVEVINLMISGNTTIYDDYWDHEKSCVNSYGETVVSTNFYLFGIRAWLDELKCQLLPSPLK